MVKTVENDVHGRAVLWLKQSNQTYIQRSVSPTIQVVEEVQNICVEYK